MDKRHRREERKEEERKEDDAQTEEQDLENHEWGLRTQRMLIWIQTASGKIQVFVEPTTTVETLKGRIFQQTQIPTDIQHFVYSGRGLQDSETMADCGITRNTTLHLLLRLRGGTNEVAVSRGRSYLIPKPGRNLS